MADRVDFYFRQRVTEAELDLACELLEQADEVLEERKRDLVYPKRINPLTAFPGAPRHIDGARTLKGDGNFPTVAERRGVIFIEQSLKLGLLFAKHKNNTEALRSTLARTDTPPVTCMHASRGATANDHDS